MAEAPDDVFYAHLTREMSQGRITPFLGAGVNLAGMNTQTAFEPGTRLPNGAELARQVAKEYSYPFGDNDLDLLRVTQWAADRTSIDGLYIYLHSIFDRDFRATPVHEVLASVPAYVRRQPVTDYPLIFTTNYDDTLERAFADRDEPLDVLTYVANEEDKDRGLFRHVGPDGGSKIIKVANKYPGVTLRERPVVVKLHGAVRRAPDSYPPEDDSYVVTEDDYVDCLTRNDITANLPMAVRTRMKRCNYLFLGYSLRDWNLRVMLHRIWKDRARHVNWAVVSAPDPLEEEAWKWRKVVMFDLDLGEFAAKMRRHLEDGPESGAP